MKTIKYSNDFQEFCELNEEYIYDNAQEEMYEDGNYLDDYDVSNIEIPQWKFESVAETLFWMLTDHIEFMAPLLLERPEHFKEITMEKIERFYKYKNNEYYKRLGENIDYGLLLTLVK